MPSRVHAIMFPRKEWTFEEANNWITEHGHQPICVHVYPNFWRFSMTRKSKYVRYRTKGLIGSRRRPIEIAFEFDQGIPAKGKRIV